MQAAGPVCPICGRSRDPSHWQLVQQFTVRQAAMLWVGEDPAMPTEGDRRFEVVARQLEEAIEGGTLETIDVVQDVRSQDEDPDTGIVHVEYGIHWDLTILNRQQLARWVRSRGVDPPPFLERDVAELPPDVSADEAPARPIEVDGFGVEVPAGVSPDRPSRGKTANERRKRGSGADEQPDWWAPTGKIGNAEAAASVNVQPETLNSWRSKGYPPVPPSSKTGSQVYYDRAEWDAFAQRYSAGEFSKRHRG